MANIPNDVLQEIFVLCLPSAYWAISLTPSEAPVLLTHICQRWRKVATDFPTLWSSLRWCALWEKVNDAKIETYESMAAHARSAPRAMQIIVFRTPGFRGTTGHPSGFGSPPNIPKRLFMPNAPSLTRLLLRGIPITHLHDLPCGSSYFPSLVVLALHLQQSDLEDFPWSEKGPIKAFSNAPSLRRVALAASLPFGSSHSTYISPNVHLPWEQLTHVADFASPAHGPNSIYDYLQKCCELRVLFVELHDRDVGTDGLVNWTGRSANPVTLEKLESLTINYWGGDDNHIVYPAFMDAFRLPALRALRLEGSELDFPNAQSWSKPTVDLMSKLSSFHHLTYLSICSASVELPSIRQVFSATPNVTTLDAQIFANYQNLFDVLAWNLADGLLPKLETLVLDVDDCEARSDGEGDPIDVDLFGEFLNSRLGAHTPFRSVIVYASQQSFVDDDVPFITEALKYSSRGLDLERRLVTEERERKPAFEWIDRDPEMQDWPELGEILCI